MGPLEYIMKIANCILVTIVTISTTMIMVIIINIMSVQEANPLICFSVNNPPSVAGCSAHPPPTMCYPLSLDNHHPPYDATTTTTLCELSHQISTNTTQNVLPTITR